MNDSTHHVGRAKIRARQAGREELSSFAAVSTAELQIALSLDPPAGIEFSLRRELRRRDRARGGWSR